MSGPGIRGVSDIRVATSLPAETSPPAEVGRRNKIRQPLMVLTVLAAVIVVDQATKWWAWRHVAGAEINSGGDLLVGPAISVWYKEPVTGALLDLLDFGLLTIAVSALVRRRRPAAVAVAGGLMLGGWGSNLLDRLGLHYWITPGSVRGVVDFIDVGGAHYNVADAFIVGATPLFLLAVACLGWRARNRPATIGAMAPAARHRARASVLTLASAGLVVVAVALGAANYGGVSIAPAHVSSKDDAPVRSVVVI
jgi:lipoprotein signal peptidase